MDDAVTRYIDAIDPAHRPLFDRVHGLILQACPDAAVVISYQIPTYKVGKKKLFLGAWQHGVSLYGWHDGDDAGFTARHPELVTGRSTIRLRTQDSATIADEELRDLARAVLGA